MSLVLQTSGELYSAVFLEISVTKVGPLHFEIKREMAQLSFGTLS